MKIAVTICATKKYTYAMSAQARRVQSSLINREKGTIILCGDGKELESYKSLYKDLVPHWDCIVLDLKGLGEHRNYKESAQLVIGQMRTAAFAKARSLGVDYCWSLDSDVLPPPNALTCMLQSLEFDDGYYSISMVTYPSQGGGGFLGGRGTPQNQIAPDYYEHEREIPEDLKKELEEVRAGIKEKPDNEELHKKHAELSDKVRECKPKGNVWKVNADFGWELRGWMDNAYPGIGRGAILPSDWCGFGCTLMNREALDHAHFDGYEGKGTEDLYIGWRRWYPQGLKINVITHVLCDHVVRNPGNPGHFVLCQAYHETEGKCIGHIRLRHLPWYSFDAGETFNPKNDGRLKPEEKPKEEAKSLN